MSAPRFTYSELAECAKRELKMRKYVYAQRVEERKMYQKQADREIGMMEAIMLHLEELATKKEKLL